MARDWRSRRDVRRLQIFVSDLGATGVVRNAIAIANSAVESGYQVRLLTCCADGVLRRELSSMVTVVRLNEPRDAARSRRVQMQRALIAYRAHCRAWKPDILISAGNHGHLLSSLAWLGLPGTKVLRISNDLTHGSPALPTRLWRAAKFAVLARLADQLVYVSHVQRQHPLLARQLSSGKALVISNGVDLHHVRRAARQPCEHPWAGDPAVPVVLAVGRHARQKNFEVLVRAFARARKHRPMRLLFLGEGPSQETERLRALASALEVGEDVDFVPPVANPFPYMRCCQVLALPSLWEGSSNVLLEAMACGTPVVASQTAGDAAYVLGYGRYGLLTEPGDVEGLAAALLQQAGPGAVRPGNRAEEFSRADALRRYAQLFEAIFTTGPDSRFPACGTYSRGAGLRV